MVECIVGYWRSGAHRGFSQVFLIGDGISLEVLLVRMVLRSSSEESDRNGELMWSWWEWSGVGGGSLTEWLCILMVLSEFLEGGV